jgi:hypothetical protein
MPLWKANSDPAVAATAKPQWLKASNIKPKKDQNFANTYGVNRSATANNAGKGWSPGWAVVQRGTGPVTAVNITTLSPGGYTVNSNVTVTFTSPTGSGANGIAQFVGGNLTSILIDAGGAGYANAPSVVVSGGNGNTGATTLAAVVGGRANRARYEILVATKGNMAGVKDKANVDNLGLGL